MQELEDAPGISTVIEEETVLPMSEQFLTFVLGDEIYGIGVSDVSEIVGRQRVVPVPDLPPFIKGLINLRGTLVPVMDVRIRLGMPPRSPDKRTCIIVTCLGQTNVGLLVDTVAEVLLIDDDRIQAPPRRSLPDQVLGVVKGLARLGDEVKILIDTNALVFAEGMNPAPSTDSADLL